MMCCTFSMSMANCITLRQFRSEWTTTLATLRWTNNSPGIKPTISLAGTRLSEQPIHRYCGSCWRKRLVKKPGVRASVASAQRRLLSNSSCNCVVMRNSSEGARSHRLREQLAPNQHPADLARAGTDLVQLRVAPQPAERIVVDIAVAAEYLDAFAGHPGCFLGAPQDHARAVLAHLAHMLAAEQVEVFAHRVAKRPRCLQHGVHVADLALDQLELADALAELLAVVDVGHDVVHHRLHDAHRPGREHRALVVEPAHQYLRAAVQGAEHVRSRHFDVVEHQLAGVA